MSTRKRNRTSPKKSGDICVYLGPTIVGTIQSGTIYKGSKKAVMEQLSYAIEKYPLIARLLVTKDTLTEDRIKVKTQGNAINEAYRKLASSLKK